MKLYTVKRKVVEYYEVWANSKAEAIEISLEEGSPYAIVIKSERAFLDMPAKKAIEGEGK